MFLVTEKYRIYAVCGVSQTPRNLVDLKGEPHYLYVTGDIGGTKLFMQKILYEYFKFLDKLISQSHRTKIDLPDAKPNFIYVEKELNAGQSEFYFRIEVGEMQWNCERTLPDDW